MKKFTRTLLACIIAFAGIQSLMGEVFSKDEIDGTFLLSEVDHPPQAIRQIEPQLDQSLVGQSGKVKVAFLITADGMVDKARVVDSTNVRLNEITVKAIREWRFKPAQKDGTPVVVRVAMPVRIR